MKCSSLWVMLTLLLSYDVEYDQPAAWSIGFVSATRTFCNISSFVTLMCFRSFHYIHLDKECKHWTNMADYSVENCFVRAEHYVRNSDYEKITEAVQTTKFVILKGTRVRFFWNQYRNILCVKMSVVVWLTSSFYWNHLTIAPDQY